MSTPFAFSLKAQQELTIHLYCDILNLQATTDLIVAYRPFKYRGYYYDRDMELYYLGSRYYDAYTGRFINVDGYVSTGQGILGNNMFAYCNNNPVNMVDYTGEDPISVALLCGIVAVSALIVAGLSWLVYDMTHEQILGNAFVDAIDAVADAATNIVEGDQDLFEKKTDAKEEVINQPQYNYWTASIINGVVTPGAPLTYSQAREWVAAENDLLCRNHAAAIAIVKFYPSARWDAAHKGGEKDGYLNHYHLNGEHSNHIWYYGN